MSRSSAARQLPLFPEEPPDPRVVEALNESRRFVDRLEELVKSKVITRQQAEVYLKKAIAEDEKIDLRYDKATRCVEEVNRKIEALKMLARKDIGIDPPKYFKDEGKEMRDQLYAYLRQDRTRQHKLFRENMIKEIIRIALKEASNAPRAS